MLGSEINYYLIPILYDSFFPVSTLCYCTHSPQIHCWLVKKRNLDVSLVASGSESWIGEKLMVILAHSECLS